MDFLRWCSVQTLNKEEFHTLSVSVLPSHKIGCDYACIVLVQRSMQCALKGIFPEQNDYFPILPSRHLVLRGFPINTAGYKRTDVTAPRLGWCRGCQAVLLVFSAQT